MNNTIDKISLQLATVFKIGFIKYAPGTFGSLPGLLLGYLLSTISSTSILVIVFTIICFISTQVIANVEKKYFKDHDNKEIVIDEVCGQALTIMFFSITVEHLIVGFILFRLFDIIKPSVIGYVDKNFQSPFGTLLDDLLAGLFACVGLALYAWLFI